MQKNVPFLMQSLIDKLVMLGDSADKIDKT